jgi:hypothetical protein
LLGLFIAIALAGYWFGQKRDAATIYRWSTNFLLIYYVLTTAILFTCWHFAIGIGAIISYWAFGPVAALFAVGTGAAVAVFTVGVQMLLLITAAVFLRLAQEQKKNALNGQMEITFDWLRFLIGVLLYILVLYLGW